MIASRFLATCGVAALIAAGSADAATEKGVPASRAHHHGPAPVKPAEKTPTATVPSLPPLVSDPAIHYGRLANGMRYALRRNATPATGASFRLRIGTGSLSEQDDQRGLMHFIEHMVFNGSRHVTEGDFAQKLERHGLAFGADVNAYTTYDETVYQLDLPETDADTVDTALFLFREVAGESTMLDASIDRERGVVLSEERLRASPSSRAQDAQLDYYARGQLLGKRAPIGKVDILRQAKSDQFLKLYHQYYRPENAIFAAVGNFDPAELEAKLKAKFGDWHGVGAAGPKPKLGPVAPRGLEAGTYSEPGGPQSLHVAWNNPPDLPDSSAKRRKDIIELLAINVLNRRMGKLALSDHPPFVLASVSNTTLFKSLDEADLLVGYESGQWRQALTAAETERRRAVDYGISQRELDREIAEFRRQVLSGVTGEATRDSGSLADQIVGNMSEGKVFTTPESSLVRFDSYTKGLTAADVGAVFKKLFTGQGPLIYVTDTAPIVGGDAAVLQAYNAAAKLAVSAPVAPTDKQWTYTDFGTPGHVAERREIADLGVTFVRFDNGVRLTVRPSKTSQNNIQVSARIGDGLLGLPTDKPTAAWLAQAGLIEGGLGKLTATEIDDTLVGKQYGASIDIAEDAFILSGSTQPDDLATQMQVLTAIVTDPAYRSDGVERAKAQAADNEKQMMTSSSGPLVLGIGKLLHPGDLRFQYTPLADRLAMGIDDLRTMLAPLKTGPIDIVMVGDVTVEDAIKQTAATFGALPPRAPSSVVQPTRTTLSIATAQPVKFTHFGRKDQALGAVLWPTNDYFADYQEFMTAGVLTAVLQLRMLDEFREKQGLTYAPGISKMASKVFPGFGYALASIEAPSDKLPGFFVDIDRIVKSLRDTPPTQDEFDRAVRPQIEAVQHLRETNDYWLNALGGAQTDPRKIDVIRQAIPDLKRVDPADVQRIAAKYLLPDKELRLESVPFVPTSAAK